MSLDHVIRCSDPLHGARKGQPGWADELGRSDRELDGMICEACAAAQRAELVAEPEPSVEERLAALEEKTAALPDLPAAPD